MITLWTDSACDVEVVRLIERDEIRALGCLFDAVVAEKGWQPGEDLSCGQHREVYFGLLIRGEIAGGLQIAFPDAQGNLACRHVWPEVPISPQGRCAHVELLAVDKCYRGQEFLFWHLAAEMWRYCVSEGVSRLYVEANPRNYCLYRRIGWPLQIQAEPRIHWGAETYLCTLDIADVAKSILERSEKSEQYREIVAQTFRVSFRRKFEARSQSTSLTLAGTKS